MQTLAQAENPTMEMTPMNLYNSFVERIRRNLHVILAFSPIGDAFRNRLRQFPSLINCCTIDWFKPWPEDALELVANRFLDSVEMSNENRQQTVIMCKIFHQSVVDLSEKFWQMMRRRIYITPTFFLELIKTFKSLLDKKRQELLTLKNRYLVGLEKLEFSGRQVEDMKKELTEKQPLLEKKNIESEELMKVIIAETEQVEEKKKLVEADEAVANQSAQEARAIKEECEEKLAEAMPAMQAAVAALDTLNANDISMVKSMKKPPGGVRLVMEAVCCMKGIKPAKVKDPSTGKSQEDYWPEAQKMLADMKFLDSLREYDKDNINPAIIKVVRDKYITNPDFVPEVIQKVSSACEGLCKWVRAIEVYDRVAKVVAPKKKSLEAAESSLAEQMSKLEAKQAELKTYLDKLAAFEKEFNAKAEEKKMLESDIQLCSVKIIRAEKLISGLGGERDRWTQIVDDLSKTYDNIIGDVLLSAGIVTYLGPLTLQFRQVCLPQPVTPRDT